LEIETQIDINDVYPALFWYMKMKASTNC